RTAAGPAPKAVWWRRLVLPLAGVCALGIIGVVAYKANEQVSSPEADIIKAERAAPTRKMAEAAPAEKEAGPALDETRPSASMAASVPTSEGYKRKAAPAKNNKEIYYAPPAREEQVARDDSKPVGYGLSPGNVPAAMPPPPPTQAQAPAPMAKKSAAAKDL